MTATARPQLTDRQREVYEWICKTYAGRGYGIAIREIGEAFGWSSPSAAYCHLVYLEKRGYVTRVPGRAYSIVPIREANDD
jgi:repressor LexA